MRPCYFTKEPPEVEIRGDHIFIRPAHTDEFELATTANVLQRTIARYMAVLEEFYRTKGEVIPIKRRA